MDSYTTRPESVDWTAITYDGFSAGQSATTSETSGSYRTEAAASGYGRTASRSDASQAVSLRTLFSGETTDALSATRSYSRDGGTTATHDPPTVTVPTTSGTNSTAFTATSTVTLDYTWEAHLVAGSTTAWAQINGDTSEGYSESISITSSEAYSQAQTDTGSGETSHVETLGTTAYTYSDGTTSSLYSGTETAYYRAVTSTETTAVTRMHTTSSSASTTTGTATSDTTTSSTWGTAVSTSSATTTVISDAYGESSAAATYQDLTVDAVTTTSIFAGTVTVTVDRESYSVTIHEFETEVRNTVFLMPAVQIEDDHNQSHVLWKWSRTDMAAGSTYAGAFSEFYSSDAASIITMEDFGSWHTSSRAAGTLTLSRGTTTAPSSTGTAATDTVSTESTVTFTNGSWFSAASDSSETYVISFSDGPDIGTTSTSGSYATGTATSDTATSSTSWFSQATTVSGYESTGAKPWTSATSSTLWGISTSRSSTRPVWWSSMETTVRRSHRDTTGETILVSVHSTTADTTTTGTAATDSATTAVPVFVGMSTAASTRVHTAWSTHTTTATTEGVEREQWQSSRASSHEDATTVTVSSGTGTGDTSSAAGTLTSWITEATTISQDHALSEWTASRLLPEVTSSDTQIEAWGYARHRAMPNGYAGFHSSGTTAITAALVHLTSSTGTAAGTDFGDAYLAVPAASATESGPVVWPIGTLSPATLNAPGLVSSSVIDPSAGTFAVLSVAATLTSSSTSHTSETTGSVTTRSATYTAEALSSISGDYFSDEEITWNSEDSNIGLLGCYAATGGHGAGNDRSGSHTLFLPHGRATWTTLTGSTGGTASSSGTSASLSITIPQGAAAVVSCEPVLTAEWRNDEGQRDHYVSTTPYISHSLETP